MQEVMRAQNEPGEPFIKSLQEIHADKILDEEKKAEKEALEALEKKRRENPEEGTEGTEMAEEEVKEIDFD